MVCASWKLYLSLSSCITKFYCQGAEVIPSHITKPLEIPTTGEDPHHLHVVGIRTPDVVQLLLCPVMQSQGRCSAVCVCVLQVALEGEGEDFLPKAWGKFHCTKHSKDTSLCASFVVPFSFISKAKTGEC